MEDEASIGRLVADYLKDEGFAVVWVRSGEEALAELPRHPVRLMVLDIGLPGIDGFEVCRRVRATSDLPVLMLTARDEEIDRVSGFAVGADDYVSKPFSPRELAARVKAILRRVEPRPAATKLVLADVVLRRDAHEVTVGGHAVELTPREFELLAFFMENPGVVLERDRLLERAWASSSQEARGLWTSMSLSCVLKVGENLIETVFGVGYKAVRR